MLAYVLTEMADHLLGQAAPGNPILPWVGASGMTGLLGFLYWTERQDRKAAEERERVTYKEYTDRISKEVSTLEKTGDLVLELSRRTP